MAEQKEQQPQSTIVPELWLLLFLFSHITSLPFCSRMRSRRASRSGLVTNFFC